MAGKVTGAVCVRCASEVKLLKGIYVCPSCGGNLQIRYDYAAIRKRMTRKSLEANRDRSIWRYLDILPVESARYAPPVHIGFTPLYPSRNLGRQLGLSSLFIKDDGRNPSASFKDRAGAIVLADVLERGEKNIAGASTGNAASSLACLSAGLGVKPIIFVPEAAPVAKIAQLLVFGATVIAVKGNYDQAFDLCLKACEEYGWYNRNTGFNPYTREGKKTCSFEIIEQLGWNCPDYIVVPVGDGNIITGIWKGFRDFHELGLIDRMPKLIAVQSGESDSIKRAFESGTSGPVQLPVVSGNTIADSISVSLPRDGEAAVQALRESGGFAVGVSDEEVLEAIKTIARSEGVFAEPAGAAGVAGLVRAARDGKVKADDKVVVLITGNGLKDVASAMKAVGKPHSVVPDAGELRSLVSSLGIGL